jgi:type II secretory pathway pseudopilin PulG
MKNKFLTECGQSLIEVILAIGLSAIILPALLTGLVSSRQGKAQQSQRTQAVYLLNETADALRNIREKGWESFAVNGTFHPTISETTWVLTPGSATVNGFNQSVVISDINRNANGEIVTSGGMLDLSSKKVDISISWDQPYTSTVREALYLTRYLSNNSFTQTTVADFNAGSRSGAMITNTTGGEITLQAGGRGDWCSPNLSLLALDLPKDGVANSINAIEGRVFVGTGENALGVSFANVNVTTAYPPSASVLGTFDGYKTNAVFGETGYAYLATDDSLKEIEIVDITNTPYVEAGYFDAPENGSGSSIFVSGNIGYMTSGNNLYSFDLSNKNGSRPQIGSVSLAGTGTKIFIVGAYAYVAINNSSTQMQVIDISNPGSMSVVGQASVDGQGALDIFVNPSATRAYLITSSSSSQEEFFVIDVSIKTGNRPVIGSYETGEMSPKGITAVTNNKAILVGTGGEEYQVVDFSTESNPARCGGLNIDVGISGVSSVVQNNGDAFSYIITGDPNSELKIIEGGPGGTYSSSGDFTSGTFDAGYSVAFNRFDVSVNKPHATDAKFQVAVSPTTDGDCDKATFSFIGPDGTSSTFFTPDVTSGTQIFSFSIPANLNQNRCFKYKTFLSTADFTANPILNDITVNYSQ